MSDMNNARDPSVLPLCCHAYHYIIRLYTERHTMSGYFEFIVLNLQDVVLKINSKLCFCASLSSYIMVLYVVLENSLL